MISFRYRGTEGNGNERADAGPRNGHHRIFTQEEFTVLVDQERARCDRAGSVFSLVALEFGEGRSQGEAARLLGIAEGRMRLADQMGWLDGNTLGVLLPGSGHEGAWRFALDLEKRLAPRLAPPPFTVSTYPSPWYGDGRHSPAEIGSRRENRPRPRSAAGGAGAASASRAGPGISATAARLTPLEDRRLQGMLVHGIPPWKRALDITGAAIGLLACLLPFALIALYIRLVSRGPVFFRQERIGYLGRPFTFLKFRSMHVDTEQSSHERHLKELIGSDRPMEKLDAVRDPRIIPGGRLLRRTFLDELPQLLNVLAGDMSLVGPRPCLRYEAEVFSRWHAGRFDTTPGMTGLWQISGKNALSFSEMVRLDIAYVRHRCLWLDLRILLATPLTVLREAMNSRGTGGKPFPSQGARPEDPLGICGELELIAASQQ